MRRGDVQMIRQVQVPVAARDINRGETIDAKDITYVSMNDIDVVTNVIMDEDAIVGRLTKHPIRAGQTLRGFDIFRPTAVERGKLVTIVWSTAAMNLTAQGLAQQPGGIGDVIRVTLLFYLAPVWGTLLAILFLGQRLTRWRALSVVFGLAGAMVVLGSVIPVPHAGSEWMALGSGMSFAAAAAIIARIGTLGNVEKNFASLSGTALFGLGVASALVSLGSNLISMPDFTTAMVAMIGLGVGIDYALFIVTRYREALKAGVDVLKINAAELQELMRKGRDGTLNISRPGASKGARASTMISSGSIPVLITPSKWPVIGMRRSPRARERRTFTHARGGAGAGGSLWRD
jgi:flagella basal body P-ring formation protein FlgA